MLYLVASRVFVHNSRTKLSVVFMLSMIVAAYTRSYYMPHRLPLAYLHSELQHLHYAHTPHIEIFLSCCCSWWGSIHSHCSALSPALCYDVHLLVQSKPLSYIPTLGTIIQGPESCFCRILPIFQGQNYGLPHRPAILCCVIIIQFNFSKINNYFMSPWLQYLLQSQYYW